MSQEFIDSVTLLGINIEKMRDEVLCCERVELRSQLT